jgi:FtsP/CotA-like multicopper oxidase with cupredoxin domain
LHIIHRRRDLLKLGVLAGSAALPPRSFAQQQNLLNYLCPPDGAPPVLQTKPSPPVRPFVAPLRIPPIKQPILTLDPPPDQRAHQRYNEFLPKKLYTVHQQEFKQVYHPDRPYSNGTWNWGWDGITPGPTYIARYGEPVLVRIFNDLPIIGAGNVNFAMPSTTTHLHNAHTASESDGYPMNWIDSGEFWDHHYGNFAADNDPREKLHTLWYHDHRLDFTAANVYAGLAGFYLLFDEQDSGDENDPDPQAWHLPSGKYDVPLLLHDIQFDQNGQVIFDPFNTDGILGDRYTVNRVIQPFFVAERRKYRFRILNGGPSRFYQLYITNGDDKPVPFVIVTGDGNFLPAPVCVENVYLSVAQRIDAIIDFSQFRAGDHVYLRNRLEQTNGKGPSGDLLAVGQDIMRFDITDAAGPDRSCIPTRFRELPPVDMSLVKQHREWAFDYDGGLWTINGRIMDPARIDAGIEQGSAEIWTLRNTGKNWAHPIHSHFTEFLLLEVNGRPIDEQTIQSRAGRHNEYRPIPEATAAATTSTVTTCNPQVCVANPVPVFMGGRRRDITTLLPNDEIKIYMRWADFFGKYVMHCHNVVHEDHAMMIRWDIVEPGKGFIGPKPAKEVETPHVEPRPAHTTTMENSSNG